MSRVEFPAMGTTVTAISERAEQVEEFFAAAEAVFSRFDANSELTALNDDPRSVVEVSVLMAGCLHAAAELRARTNGLIDPAVGGTLVDWGYDRSFDEIADRASVGPVRDVGRWAITENLVWRSTGTRLDLGGVAKGWTADRAVRSGWARVVSAGGDVRSDLRDTTVAIEDPWGDTAARVRLGRGGLATSSSTRRRWTAGDEAVHHIIDPRRSRPAVSPVFSATVAAATAAEAEAGAKAVLLHGEHGLVWAEEQDWIDAALVVWQDGNVYATTGWDIAA